MPNFTKITLTPKWPELVNLRAAQAQREREWPDTKERTTEPKPMEGK